MWVSRSEMEYQESLELNKKMQNLSIEEGSNNNLLNVNTYAYDESQKHPSSQANTAREINIQTSLLSSNDNPESIKQNHTVNFPITQFQLGRLHH